MSEEEFTNWQKKLFAALLVAILGGNTLGFLNMRNSDVRSDPFTGTQGRQLQNELATINAIQQTMLHRMATREREDRELEARVRELERGR